MRSLSLVRTQHNPILNLVLKSKVCCIQKVPQIYFSLEVGFYIKRNHLKFLLEEGNDREEKRLCYTDEIGLIFHGKWSYFPPSQQFKKKFKKEDYN